jgi:hypothetical protein
VITYRVSPDAHGWTVVLGDGTIVHTISYCEAKRQADVHRLSLRLWWFTEWGYNPVLFGEPSWSRSAVPAPCDN